MLQSGMKKDRKQQQSEEQFESNDQSQDKPQSKFKINEMDQLNLTQFNESASKNKKKPFEYNEKSNEN